jgi:dihydrolipoamide dehydrogenase
MVMGSLRQEAEVVVVGGGPGGYVAALRAADLGKEVILVEERERLGGVCLLEGCIPSKALISAVELAVAARAAEQMGLHIDGVRFDLSALRAWTDSIVDDLARGVSALLARRGVQVVRGRARLEGPGALAVEGGEVGGIDFRDCVLATGSRINVIPPAYTLPVWSSAEALRLPEVPARLCVVGGGYIGLELGLVYAGLGSKVIVVEFFPRLLPGADPDLVDAMVRHASGRLDKILVESRVVGLEKTATGYAVSLEHEGKRSTEEVDQVLVAVGRRPATDGLGLEKVGLETIGQGFLPVDAAGRTRAPHVYAIGDITPGPMLAHKASREAKVVAEVLAGQPSAFDNRAIPAVVFTDPEIAWTGLTETEARERGQTVRTARFPLTALGRARTLGRTEGFVKILSDPETSAVLGVGMVGPHVSELIAEGTLAIEMGATLEDLLVTIHPHPTMSEALMEAAEVGAGQPIHVNPKRGT